MSYFNKKIGNYELMIEFEYQPEEEQTRDYPGCHENAEVHAVHLYTGNGNSRDIIDIIVEFGGEDKLDQWALEYVHQKQKEAEMDRAEQFYNDKNG